MKICNNRTIMSLVLMMAAVVAIICIGAGCGRQGGSKSAAPVSTINVGSKAPNQNVGTSGKLEPSKPSEEAGLKLALRGQRPTLNWVENGELRMRATAREMHGDEVNRVAVLKDFSGEMYEDGKMSTMMTAPKVIADTPKRIVTASDGVMLKSLDRKTVVTAKWIRWYSKEQKVIGVGDVKITLETGITMAGPIFVADTALKTLTIKYSAKGLDL